MCVYFDLTVQILEKTDPTKAPGLVRKEPRDGHPPPNASYRMNRPGVSCSARAHDHYVIAGSVLIAVIQAETAESRRLHKLQHFLRRK